MNSTQSNASASSADLQLLYQELREEIETIGQADRTTETLRFADPAKLNRIERRTLTKSVFSFIEAIAFGMKAYALKNPLATSRLTAAELMLAAEQDHELTETGEIVIRRARLRTLSNIRFAFRVFAKLDDTSFELDVSGAGWQSTRRALKVRDRLMHPKTASDLVVDDDEVHDALASFLWFDQQLILAFTQANKKLREERELLREQIELLKQNRPRAKR